MTQVENDALRRHFSVFGLLCLVFPTPAAVPLWFAPNPPERPRLQLQQMLKRRVNIGFALVGRPEP